MQPGVWLSLEQPQRPHLSCVIYSAHPPGRHGNHRFPGARRQEFKDARKTSLAPEAWIDPTQKCAQHSEQFPFVLRSVRSSRDSSWERCPDGTVVLSVAQLVWSTDQSSSVVFPCSKYGMSEAVRRVCFRETKDSKGELASVSTPNKGSLRVNTESANKSFNC